MFLNSSHQITKVMGFASKGLTSAKKAFLYIEALAAKGKDQKCAEVLRKIFRRTDFGSALCKNDAMFGKTGNNILHILAKAGMMRSLFELLYMSKKYGIKGMNPFFENQEGISAMHLTLTCTKKSKRNLLCSLLLHRQKFIDEWYDQLEQTRKSIKQMQLKYKKK